MTYVSSNRHEPAVAGAPRYGAARPALGSGRRAPRGRDGNPAPGGRGARAHRDARHGAVVRRVELDRAPPHVVNLDMSLQPHNEHFVLVQVAIYRLLFATVGLQHSLPYRAVMVVAESASVLLVFVYARRRWAAAAARPGRRPRRRRRSSCRALAGTRPRPFEIGWLISVGAGVACLLALDRHDRRGDIAAAALLAVSLASSGVGVVIAVGIAVEILAVRRRPGDLWIVAAPAILLQISGGSAITLS